MSQCLDVLHVLDQGVCQHVIGNILFDIVYKRISGNVQNALARVWARIRELYDKFGTQYRVTC